MARIRSVLRLDWRFRWGLYGVFAALFASGIVWIVADRLKDPGDAEFWQIVGADMLMIHGGIAMVTLLLLGALLPAHIARAWRGRINRGSGAVMIAVNAVLIVTAFGLYYLGSEMLRPWISDVHIAVGFVTPPLIVFHIWFGRRRRRASPAVR
jgi:hypothetical protein